MNKEEYLQVMNIKIKIPRIIAKITNTYFAKVSNTLGKKKEGAMTRGIVKKDSEKRL